MAAGSPPSLLEPLPRPLASTIAARVAGFRRRALAAEELRSAAVACLVAVDAEGRPAFVLTRRSASLRAHAGQWALPGGRVEPGEDLAVAACRELAEELGVEVQPDDVVGLLDDYPTRSGYCITPVVVCLRQPAVLRPDPAEVDEVHLVPFAALDRPDSPRYVRIAESPRPVVQLPLLGDLIHAPTAAVVHQLHQAVSHGRTVRVAHLEQPVFAWK